MNLKDLQLTIEFLFDSRREVEIWKKNRKSNFRIFVSISISKQYKQKNRRGKRCATAVCVLFFCSSFQGINLNMIFNRILFYFIYIPSLLLRRLCAADGLLWLPFCSSLLIGSSEQINDMQSSSLSFLPFEVIHIHSNQIDIFRFYFILFSVFFLRCSRI